MFRTCWFLGKRILRSIFVLIVSIKGKTKLPPPRAALTRRTYAAFCFYVAVGKVLWYYCMEWWARANREPLQPRILINRRKRLLSQRWASCGIHPWRKKRDKHPPAAGVEGARVPTLRLWLRPRRARSGRPRRSACATGCCGPCGGLLLPFRSAAPPRMYAKQQRPHLVACGPDSMSQLLPL